MALSSYSVDIIFQLHFMDILLEFFFTFLNSQAQKACLVGHNMGRISREVGWIARGCSYIWTLKNYCIGPQE
jgi:hypothetical protein